MRIQRSPLLSAFGVPVLGLGALLFSLGHAGPTVTSQEDDASRVYLIQPDARLDRSLTVCLRQQAKDVAVCRARLRRAEASGRDAFRSVGRRRDGLAQAVGGYNLIARECTPAVFETTHLPPALNP